MSGGVADRGRDGGALAGGLPKKVAATIVTKLLDV